MSEPGKTCARSVRIVSVAMGNDRNDALPGPPSSRRSRSARRAPGPRETVRRHPALVPLSEQHHHELAHARRLLRAAGAGPEERLAVASAYIDAFFTETVGHFRREEEILFPLYLRHAGSTPVLERILREHMELHGLVRALRAEAAAGNIAPETLRTLGDLLHDHVRVEERELFEEIERIVPAAELEGVRLYEESV
jgi:hemerythrin-like domain-containing protein